MLQEGPIKIYFGGEDNEDPVDMEIDGIQYHIRDRESKTLEVVGWNPIRSRRKVKEEENNDEESYFQVVIPPTITDRHGIQWSVTRILGETFLRPV